MMQKFHLYLQEMVVISTQQLNLERIDSIYSYSILDQNRKIIQTFESSAIIKSTDAAINNISLNLDQDLQNGGMLVGNIYRYHIYANLTNGSKIDIFKIITLKCTSILPKMLIYLKR